MVKISSPERFAKVRELLDSQDYTEAALCRRLGLESLLKFEAGADSVHAEGWDTDGQGLLIRLFVENRYVPVALAVEFFGEDAVQTLADLGLIERKADNEDEISATVSLYPTAGVYVISDRWNHPDRTPYKPPEDVVYPGHRFERPVLPEISCREHPAVTCSISGPVPGVAALSAAKQFAERATGVDIAQRSCLFAEFNRQLNGLDNVTIGHGDLYEPVAGQQFDRIVAHPPYVPVFRHRYIYRDGGPDGEQIVQRVIEGLPAHLAPGGMFYLMALVSDREQELFEQRVRRWLGDAHSDFDVANFPLNSVEPDEYAARAAVHTEKPSEDLKSLPKAVP